MNSLQVTKSVLFLVLIVQCESKTEIGDYIVDCSACQFAPLIEVKSYSCMVRCEAQGKSLLRITSQFSLNVLTEFAEPASFCVRNQDATIAPAGNICERQDI